MILGKMQSRFNSWIYPTLLGLILTATFVVRLLINYSTELIPGTNGAYYLIQARSVAQIGRLAFSDSPLTFFIHGYFSLFVNLFAGNIDKSVIFSVKILDSLLPALCALPLFLIAKIWIKDKKVLFISLLAIVFCSFHFYGFLLAGDLQKNALGMTFLLFFIYELLLAFSNQKKISFVFAGLFLALCGLTHMAVLGIAVCILIVSIPLWFFFSKSVLNGRLKIGIGIGSIFILLAFTAIVFFFQGKTNGIFSIISYPIRLFSNPYIFTILSSASTPMGNIPFPEIVNIFFNNVVIAISIWTLVKNWKTTDIAVKTVVISLISACLLLSSPLIGRAYATRFYILAYIPASVLLVYLIAFLNWQWKKSILVITTIFILFSVLLTARLEPKPSISMDVHEDLIAFKNVMGASAGKSIAVAKHGLEWWAGWTLCTAVTKEYYVTNETFKNFTNVYYLVEKASLNRHETQAGQVFPDVTVPDESQIVFEGKKITVYKANKPAQADLTNAPPVAMGMIVEVKNNLITIISPEGTKKIVLDEVTKIDDGLFLNPGVSVKIWGDEMFLSPNIKANLIIEDKNPQKPPNPPMRR